MKKLRLRLTGRADNPIGPHDCIWSMHGSIGQTYYGSDWSDFIAMAPSEVVNPYYLVKFAAPNPATGINPSARNELQLAELTHRIICHTKGAPDSGLEVAKGQDMMTVLDNAGIAPWGVAIGNEYDLGYNDGAVFASRTKTFWQWMESNFPSVKRLTNAFGAWPRPRIYLPYFDADTKALCDGVLVHSYTYTPRIHQRYGGHHQIRATMGWAHNDDTKFVINGETSMGFVDHPPGIPRIDENIRAAYLCANLLMHASVGVPHCYFNFMDEPWMLDPPVGGDPYDAEGLLDRNGVKRQSYLVYENIFARVAGDLYHLNAGDSLAPIQAGLFKEEVNSDGEVPIHLVVANAPAQDGNDDRTIIIKHCTGGAPYPDTAPEEFKAQGDEQKAATDSYRDDSTLVSLPQELLKARITYRWKFGYQSEPTSDELGNIIMPPYSAIIVSGLLPVADFDLLTKNYYATDSA